MTDQQKFKNLRDALAPMMSDMNETLRQQVNSLEDDVEKWKGIANQINTDWIPANKKLSEELAALKAGQGKPVAWMTEDGVRVATTVTKDGAMATPSKAAFCIPLYTSVPTIPAGYVLVPDDLLVRASASLGAFTSDEGWRQIDMDNMDSLDALISAAPKPKEEMK